MQIDIYKPAQGEPLPPVQWNYEELKAQLVKGLEAYKGRVYTEDTAVFAKKDRAALNKLAEAIDSKRKEMKARYLAPYEEFEAQAKELIALVKEQAAEIDAQIKTFEEARQAEKLEQIKAIYREKMAELCGLVPYEKVHEKRWLNVTTSIKSIEGQIAVKAESVRAALASIDALGLPDDMADRVKSVYLDKMDLAAALAEKDKIERERQALADYEAARQKIYDAADPDAFKKAKPGDIIRFGGDGCESAPQEAEPSEPLYTVDFRVEATTAQLGALKAFLHDNAIKYGPVPGK